MTIDLFLKGRDLVIKKVKERRSAVMSAIVKSIRLMKPEEAVLWTSLAFSSLGEWYISRRVAFSCGEDNLNLNVYKYGLEMFLFGGYKSKEKVLRAAVMAAISPTQYLYKNGRKHVLNIVRTHGSRSLKDYIKKFSKEELVQKFKEGLNEKDEYKVLAAYSIVEEERTEELMKEFAEILLEEAGKTGDTLIMECAELNLKGVGDSCKYKDDNWMWPIIYYLIYGVDEDGLRDEIDSKRVDEILEKVSKRVKKIYEGGKLPEIPSWALDGYHTSGNDGRFAGTWRGLENMVKMVEKYGRLSEQDEGVLIKRKN